jgi:hypothetical protein
MTHNRIGATLFLVMLLLSVVSAPSSLTGPCTALDDSGSEFSGATVR